MIRATAAWDRLLALCTAAFHQPSFALFQELAGAWVVCPGRRTVTAMIQMLGPNPRRAHDAYHRFLRAGAWTMATVWSVSARHRVRALAPEGEIQLDVDDTLFHKTGRKIEGAGVFRDAVRSCGKRAVYALGLNLVVLTLRVTPPWGGEPLGLAVTLGLHRKGGDLTPIDLAEAMIREVADWFPTRRLRLCGDGAYAALAGRKLPRTEVVSRMRRDAALYRLPSPRKKGERGRPRKKGGRLPRPDEMGRGRKKEWKRVEVHCRGRLEVRLVFARPVLWYHVCPNRQVLLVVVRDPHGHQPDDFFFSTDLSDSAKAVASFYPGRWSIEDTFRNVKQFLGGEDPQTWKGKGPERAASFALWLHAAVWTWYVTTQGTKKTWPSLPWYTTKKNPSFADALATLRSKLWRRRLFSNSRQRPLTRKMLDTLIEVLARAA